MDRLTLTGCTVDLVRGAVDKGDGSSVPLRAKELALLAYLAERPGQPLGRADILRDVWGYRGGVATRTLASTMQRLRAKVEGTPRKPVHLLLVQGVGYRFEPGAVAVDSVAPEPTSGISAELDRFFGRDEELEALAAARTSGVRLVVLIGPPGVGKSRLMRQYLRSVDGGSGILWCELEGKTGVQRAVGRALGMASPRGLGVRLGRALRARGPMLLALDGVEGSLAELDAVPLWLAEAPQLVVWLTSRVVPELKGMHRVSVGPLELPQAGSDWNHPAFALFRDRARHRRAGSTPVPADRRDIARIVAAVDGLPLGIELAAASVRSMEPSGLGPQLEEGRRRWATEDAVQAAVRSSWDLMSAPDQQALRQCALFQCPFTMEQALDVVSVDGEDTEDLLEALVDQSWVRVIEMPDGLTFQVYRPIARHAEGLLPSGSAALKRYVGCFAEMGQPSNLDRLDGRDADDVFRQMARSATDVQTAARVALERGWAKNAGWCAAAFGAIASRQGPLPIAIGFLEQVTGTQVADRPTTARLTLQLGKLYRLAGRHPEAKARFEAVMAADARPLDRARGLLNLADVAYFGLGDVTEAEALYRAALRGLQDGGGHLSCESHAWMHLGFLMGVGDPGRAGAAEEALCRAQAGFEQVGRLRSLVFVMQMRAQLACWRGDLLASDDMIARSLALTEAHPEVRVRSFLVILRAYNGLYAGWTGERVLEEMAQAVELVDRIGLDTAQYAHTIASVLARLGQPEETLRIVPERLADGTRPGLRAVAHMARARAYVVQERWASAVLEADAGLEAAARAGHAGNLQWARSVRSLAALGEGDLPGAVSWAEQAIELNKLRVVSLGCMALQAEALARSGQQAKASTLAEAAVQELQDRGYQRWLSVALAHRAVVVACGGGDPAGALAEARALAVPLREPDGSWVWRTLQRCEALCG
jgi:DNA-binding winged helix-turn-helix (wHTH) protein/tetratricopeptide (TPR) repeat protein